MQWIKRSKKGRWGGIKGWGEDELLLSIVKESPKESDDGQIEKGICPPWGKSIQAGRMASARA